MGRKKKTTKVVVDSLEKPPKPLLKDSNGKFAKGTGSSGGNRFAKGNTLSPTKQYFQRVKDFRSAIQNEITPEDMQQIMRHMIDTACTVGAKDAVPAARFVYSYAIGEPVRYDFEKLDKEMQEGIEKVFDVIPMEKLIELAK